MRLAGSVAVALFALGAMTCGGRERSGDPGGTGTASGAGGVGDATSAGSSTSTVGAGGSASTSSSASVGTGGGMTIPPNPAGSGGNAVVGVGGFGGSGFGGAASGGAAYAGGFVGSGGATPGAGGTGTSAGGVTYCMAPYAAPVVSATSLISDFEGDATEPLRGFVPKDAWAMDRDGTGTTSMALESCGTSGTGLHAIGSGLMRWGADVAAAFVSQVQPIDASRFGGISFVIRSAAPTSMIFKLQNPYSQPACGRCEDGPAAVVGEECYSGYIKTVAISSDTTPVVVRFDALYQQMWGYRPPGTTIVDVRNLVSIAFAFDKGVDFDVCIDDVKFVP